MLKKNPPQWRIRKTNDWNQQKSAREFWRPQRVEFESNENTGIGRTYFIDFWNQIEVM